MPMRGNYYRKKIVLSETGETKRILRGLKLHSVCEESRCPNISECFKKKTTTFLILGDTCTRNCLFCSVKKGKPATLDEEEPCRVAEAVKMLGMGYVVVTSVTRDDLRDGGAEMFRRTVEEIRNAGFTGKIEVLIPDFNGDERFIEKVVRSSPDVISHNMETVARLYPVLRSKSCYSRSLNVLKKIKELNPRQKIKSGIMLGLGETEDEVFATIEDIASTNCEFLSIGQYLAPLKVSYPVQRYFSDEEFGYFKERAYSYGFKHIESGVYVRTSYNAALYL